MAKNITNFIKTRPPLVLFTFCLLILTLSSLSLGIWVKTSKSLQNSDSQAGWLKLTEHLSEVGLCKDNEKVEEKVTKSDDNLLTSVTIPIKIDPKSFKNVTKVDAVYKVNRKSLSKIYTCQRDSLEDPSEIVKFIVEFTVTSPLSLSVETGSFLTVCGILSGPVDYLPVFSTDSCHLDPRSIVPLNYVQLSTHDENDCHGDDNTGLNFLFDGRNNEENFAVYLSESDKNGIYVHLMWFSCFMLMFVLIVILYAMFYKNNKDENW